MNPLYLARVKETPPLPKALRTLEDIDVGDAGETLPEIAALFPHLLKSYSADGLNVTPLRVGVVLSGGQAAGGHNVICGLLTALHTLNPQSELFGFLDGPAGIVDNQLKPLTQDFVKGYLNTGGFDMIGSGRTKIETPEQFASALKAVQDNRLDVVVIIGGDDSNTNAALLAEYFLAHNQPTTVIGVPKTIDGDLKNKDIEQSFGFDTAVRVYSETIGNILKDALSAKKYWFFIRLMGRSASHITLEASLETHPNLTLISEEHRSLEEIVSEMEALIVERSMLGKNYGVVLIPEGIIEFMPSLPKEVFAGMPVSYDSHGNLEVSKLETEKVFIELLKKRLPQDVPFSPVSLFLGYEGRSAFPSYFDACYCYVLGYVAALLAAKGATGQMAVVTRLKGKVEDWGYRGASLLNMLDMEERKGVLKPVIKKALVDTTSEFYKKFKEQQKGYRLVDDYISPGPIQFWGPDEVVDKRAQSLY